MFVANALKKTFDKYPDREAIISREGIHTYQDLYTQASSFANELLNRGFKKGDCRGYL